MAQEVVDLVHPWQPSIPVDWTVTTPPQGASAGKEYAAGFLAKAVADKLGLTYLPTLARPGEKRWHGRHYALEQEPFEILVKPPSVALVVDDMMTSGSTMRLSLEALRKAGVSAFGFSWCGND